MAQSLVTSSTVNNGLNTYEILRDKLKTSNSLYDDTMWNDFLHQGQDTLDTYIGMISVFGQDEKKLNSLKSNYNYDFLSNNYKLLAMSNELASDKTTTSKRKYTDANGQEIEKDMTDYEWNKFLLNEEASIAEENFKFNEWQHRADDWTFWQHVWNQVVNVVLLPGDISKGIASTAGDFWNFCQFLFMPTITDENGNPVENEVNARWEKAFSTHELNNWANEITQWERSWLGEYGDYNYYGQRENIGAFISGLGQSFGRMVPNMLLTYGTGTILGKLADAGKITTEAATSIQNTIGKTAQVAFYTLQAGSEWTEMLNDPNFANFSSLEIFMRGSVKAFFELAIENMLGEVFDRKTLIDQMTFGVFDTVGNEVTGKILAKNIVSDALQEGLEEVLQDYSGWFYDQMGMLFQHALNNDEKASIFANVSEFNFKTILSSFMAGAVMSLGGSLVNIATTKRIDTSEVKTDKDGNIIYDKKGNPVTKKLSKFKSFTYKQALDSLKTGMYEVTNNTDLDSDTRISIIKSMMTTTNTLRSLFNNVSETEMNTVFNLLNKLQGTYDESLAKKYSQAEINYTQNRLKTESYASLNTFIDSLYENNKTTSNKAKAKVASKNLSNISAKYSIKDADIEIEEKGKKNLQDLFESGDIKNVVTTKEGTGAVLANEETLILPEQQLYNSVEAEIIRDAVVTDIKQHLLENITNDTYYSAIFNEIVSMYEDFKGKTNFDTEQKVLEALFNDEKFVQYVLQNTVDGKHIVSLLSALYSITNDTQIKGYITAVKQDNCKRLTERVKALFRDYIAQHPNAQIILNENFDFFTKEDLDYIKEKSYQIRRLNDITSNNTDPTEDDVKFFSNIVNNIVYNDKGNKLTQEDKEKLIAKFKNKQTTKDATKELNKSLYYRYYSKYDNEYYFEYGSAANAMANQFLEITGYTIYDIIDYYKDDKKTYNNIVSLFKNFTNGRYAFQVMFDNQLKIIDLCTNKLDFRRAFNDKRTQTNVKTKISNFKTSDLFSSVIDDNQLKGISNLRKRSITLDELINNILFWKDDYKRISFKERINLLNNILRKNKNTENLVIDIDASGQYKVYDTKNIRSLLRKSITKKEFLVKKELNNIIKNNTYKKTYSGKYLFNTPYDFKITFINEYSGDINNYTEGYTKKGDITVYLKRPIVSGVNSKLSLVYTGEYLSANDIIDTLIHEYIHVIQDNESMSPGFSSDLLVGLFVTAEKFKNNNPKSVYANLHSTIANLVQDVLKHTNMKQSNDFLENLYNVNNYIYMSSRGEVFARGADVDIHELTTIVDDGLNTGIRLPWGSYYNLGDISITSASKNIGKYNESKDYVNTNDTKSSPYLKPLKGKYVGEKIKNLLINITKTDELKFDEGFINNAKKGKFKSIPSVLSYIKQNGVNDYTFDYISTYLFGRKITAEQKNRLLIGSNNVDKKQVPTIQMVYAAYKTLRQMRNDGVITTDKYNEIINNNSLGTDRLLGYVIKKVIVKYPDYVKLYQNLYTKSSFSEKQVNIATARLLQNFDGTFNSIAESVNAAYKYDENQKTVSINKPIDTDSTTTLENIIQKNFEKEAVFSDKEYNEAFAPSGDLENNRDTLSKAHALTTYLLYKKLVNLGKDYDIDITTTNIPNNLKSKVADVISEVREDVLNLNTNEMLSMYNKYAKNIDALLDKYDIEDIDGTFVKKNTNIRQNITQKATKTLGILSSKKLRDSFLKHITSKEFLKQLSEKYPNVDFSENGSWYMLGFTQDGEWYMPATKNENLNILRDIMSDVYKYAKDLNERKPVIKKLRETIKKQNLELSESKARERAYRVEIKELKKTVKELNLKLYNLGKDYIIINETAGSMPDIFKSLLDYSFKHLRDTKGPYVELFEKHTIKNYKEWSKACIKDLNSINSTNVDTIVNYILNSSPINSKYGTSENIHYAAISTFTLKYIIDNKYTLGLQQDLTYQIERKFQQDTSYSGTMLTLLRDAQKGISQAEAFFESARAQYSIHFDPEQVAKMIDLTNELNTISAETETKLSEPNLSKDNKLKIQKEGEIKTLKIIEEMRQLYDNMKSSAIQSTKYDKKSFLKQFQQYERMAMLSGPGTWIRNVISNQILKKGNKLTSWIGDKTWNLLNKLADKWEKTKLGKIKAPVYDTNIDTSIIVIEDLLDAHNIKDMSEDELKELKKTITKNYFKLYNDIANNNTKVLLDKLKKDISELEARNNKLNNDAKNITDIDTLQKLNNEYNSIKEEIEVLKRKSKFYENPNEVLEKLKTAQNNIDKLIKYKKEFELYNDRISGNPIRKTLKGQWKIVGTKVTDDVINYMNTYIYDSGFYDMVKEGLGSTKYENVRKSFTTSNDIVDMIKQGLISEMLRSNSFSDNKLGNILNKANEILFSTLLSDSKYIDNAFEMYLGRILVESKADLTKGITSEIQSYIKDAYVRASWDYMHQNNIIYDLENTVREKLGEKAYLVYKQFLPFMGAGWNWFIESLKYTPYGLGKALYDFAHLEKAIAKAEQKNIQGAGPSSAFTVYDIKRNIGKGAFGSAIWLVSALLGALGIIKAEEDDYGNINLKIGEDVTIDLSDLTGFNSVSIGVIMGNFMLNEDISFFDMLKMTLNDMFDDSFIGSFEDIFSRSDGLGDIFFNQLYNSSMMFIPQILKTFNAAINNRKIKYDNGLLSYLERAAVQIIPGVAYAMPKKYDPYTGELQFKQYPNILGWLLGLLGKTTPVKITVRKISNAEREALALGLSKGELTGNYSDIGKFNSKQKNTLNEVYGELNNVTLKQFTSNKIKYKVKAYDKHGNELDYYKELTYSQMNDTQKKNVINRIMTNNAKYAKIYVWTSNGHKYYATDEEFSDLRKLGLYTENTYKEGKYKKGFVD